MDELKKILEDKYNPVREVPVYIKGEKGENAVVDYDTIIEESVAKIQSAIDYDGIKEEVKELVLGEIKIPIPENGKDYIITEKDKKDIALLVDIPTVETIVEKTETIIEKPIENPETGESIIEKINELPTDTNEYKIDAAHIKNLPEFKGARVGGSTARNLFQLQDVSINNPTNDQVLKYNSTTRLWENGTGGGGGSGTPGGSNKQLQYNNSGSFGGMAYSEWDSTALLLSISALSIVGKPGTSDSAYITLIQDDYTTISLAPTGYSKLIGTSRGISFSADSGFFAELSVQSLTQARRLTLPDQDSTLATTDDLTAKLGTTLADTKIFVGNGSNVATAVSMSGDATLANTGALTIANSAVTYAKMQNVTTDRLLGRDTAGSGVVEELSVSGGIEFTGTGIQTSAFTGDVTKSAGGTALTIANDSVTYAKMQNVSATARLLGRVSSGSGDVEEVVIDNDITSVSASDDTIPSAKAVKTYVDAQPKAIFSINYAADTAAAGVNRYLALCAATLPDGGTENQRDFPLPFSGTAKNFYFITSTTQSGTGSLVLTVRKNGADTSIVITIAAGSAAGTFSNTSDTASFTAGDTLAVKVTNNASVNSAAYNGASLAFY